ncbi:hypothetical protein TSOC_008145 [Tetrabaena socialis]|uniref:Uncharacterized protein n=1 Tax=Tetrabaena socialis TaxID=47790 RepID=A0A2J7ZZB6_9CHLO|nr:hypothetical protein TSOC_008145 [Tetrabaena socialis]|eukprot:PNH05588.1 hypothetical protein TSOC_008145 [Tetrabaena socialis]
MAAPALTTRDSSIIISSSGSTTTLSGSGSGGALGPFGPAASLARLPTAEATFLAASDSAPPLAGGPLPTGAAVSPPALAASQDATPPGWAASQEGCAFGLCPGEVRGTLNTCALTAPSCVSVMSDDAEHFVAPWSYDTEGDGEGERERRAAAEGREGGGRGAAIRRLVEVATGGYYEPGLSTDAYVTNGYSRLDAAAYLVSGAVSSLTGAPPPDRPQPLRDSQGALPFDGTVLDQHDTADGGIYLRIRFGGDGGGERDTPALDADFLFPPGDSIVIIRCADAASVDTDGDALPGGRGGGSGGGGGGRLALSFERGLEWDANTARREMEALRKALRWDVVPVVSEFDPKYNNDRPLWFERLYEPFREVAGRLPSSQ